ncbi:hypothetical protein EDC01DRAFT_384133 [Geopyxis carbonaria]|nr:hypothetical protein EDC01DRAFT_384133 [Geopyxis carbonaria]
MSRKPTTYAMAMKEEVEKKTAFTFRIILPAATATRSVHVLGSWDNFTTAYPLEEDNRVGRGVWKGSLTQGGGLTMGKEYKYYLLLDHRHCIPDPQVSSDCITVDSRTGKLCSILYVPIELPPTPEEESSSPPASSHFDEASNPQLEETTISPHSVIGNSVFAGFDSEGTIFEKPRDAPHHPITTSRTPAPIKSTRNSLRDKLRNRRSVAGLFGVLDEPISRGNTESPKRRKWAMNPKASFLKLRYLKSSEGEPVLAQNPVQEEETFMPDREEQVPRNRDEFNDVIGYLRSNNTSNDASPSSHSPHSLYYSPQNTHTPNTPAYLGMGNSPYLPQRMSDGSHYSQAPSNFTSPSLSHSSTSASNSFHEPGEWRTGNVYGSEVYSKWNSSDDLDPEYNVGPSSSGLGIESKPGDSGIDINEQSGYSYPRFFNFDELKGGNRDIGRYAGDVILSGDESSVRPLRSLRDDVAGELKWRDEMVKELGYLGGVVI